MTISQIVKGVKEGSIRAQDLLSQDLAKIEEKRHLNAVIEVNPDALDIAKALDAAPDKEGALYGLPILIKDNVGTADKMRVSAGSIALAENQAKTEAPAAQKLREAGALLLGKANMTEFANYMTDWRTSPMPNGYSSRGGKTQHPIDPEADPLGSSSGSAVAVAAGLCAASIGSETYGSIVAPAQYCGVAGLKPTDGLISKEGVLPISFTLDTLGPMARTTEDVALVLGVLAGQDYDLSEDIKGLRVGICRKGGMGESRDPEWLAANLALIPLMEALGLDCVELEDHSIDDGFVYPLMQYEFKYGLNSYLASCVENPAVPKTLAEIIQYNEAHAEVALKYGQGNLLAANLVSDDWKNEPEYVQGIADRKAAIIALDQYFDANGVDLIFMTTAHYGLAAATGFPSMTVPIGKTQKGLPIGCCLMAKRLNEDVLLRVMRAIESAIA